jgi:hypothetical protein
VQSILLIDDEKRSLSDLVDAIRVQLPDTEARIEQWVPSKVDSDSPWSHLEGIVSDDVVLVVTDHDLSKGQTGLLGGSIVRWCQKRAYPAALFTRGSFKDLPEVPDLFELKIPIDAASGATIASLFRGFRDIRTAIGPLLDDPTLRSPAAILAKILEQPSLENDFAQYTIRLGAAGGALMDLVGKTAPTNAVPPIPPREERQRVLAYVVGHLLVNAVIRYPGPLLPVSCLCGYLGTTTKEADTLAELFETAVYKGPFAGTDRIFWRHQVEEIIESNLSGSGDEFTFRGLAVASLIGRPLASHECNRCDGTNGGFYCPFTKRAVCERDDCSVGSNSWLPPGATICRIEREFFDEWAPLLGF